MKKAIAILAVLSLASFAGQFAVDLDPVQRADGDWLRYDNGTLNWLTWGGMYRGVWFNTEDFVPGMGGAAVNESEFWFYHHTSYPWDTSDVYLEIWNGDAMAPVVQLDQTMATAVHLSPTLATYSTPITAETNFWALANTEMSAGGWPSIRGDSEHTDVAHSFSSDDFIIWEPWGPVTGFFSNYFVAVNVDPPEALDGATWGSLKATF